MINAYKNRFDHELRAKSRKKGLLVKMINANKSRSNVLDEILKESNDLNTINNASSSSRSASNDEYLKKFNTTMRGGPKHSIAQTRAHHLTNFLSDYIINAFQSGYFDSPEIEQLLNFKFEISNVELMCDLSALKIHWLVSRDESVNVEVEKFLDKKLRTQVRNKLVEERVINYVPKVVFVRDESRVLVDILDEYLTKINLEENAKKQEKNCEEKEEDDVVVVKKDSSTDGKQSLVDNLYGVNFNKLVETIKKDANNREWKENENDERHVSTLGAHQNEPQKNTIMPHEEKSSSFSSSLKAFEIQRKQKWQKLSKSAFIRLSQIEFEEFRQKNFDSNNK